MSALRRSGHLAFLAIILALSSFSVPAKADLVRLSASLTGSTEVPGPGDPDGTGFASVVFDTVASTVDWNITVANIGPVILDHIHVGPAGSAGPVVIDFSGNLTGSGLPVDAALLADILATPANYYANVHTTEFPGGAIRGQLSAAIASVPEPAAATLLGLGFVVLMLMARSRAVRDTIS
jgi:hypothetical protein